MKHQNNITTNLTSCTRHILQYSIAGMFGKFGKSSAIHQTKTSKVVATINNSWLIYSFVCQTFEKSKFTKHSPHQTFLLYGISTSIILHLINRTHALIDIPFDLLYSTKFWQRKTLASLTN